jgi:hypothetical protein
MVAVAFEVKGSIGVVVLLVVVDRTVEFDDEPMFGTTEIEDERTDRMLTAESRASDLLAPDRLPEGLFGGCR